MQKILKGIDNLPEIMHKIGCKRVFVVVDSSYPFLNVKDTIENLPVDSFFFSDFTPNPLFGQVSKGTESFKASGCDTILAVGGGSAIDVAKCIKLAVLSEKGTLALIPPLVSRHLPIDGERICLIALPTTAGTGSESTHNAVMYYEGAKQTVTNDGILPDYAILDSLVLETLPPYQKKCTMMDAFCQGIESWWSINSTDESIEYSKKCVELIMANWRRYIFDNDKAAAWQIMLAANYGGRAINIAQTTAAHAMSYKITSLYNLPHGHAVSVCLPEIWGYMIDHLDKCNDARGREYVRRIFDNISESMGVGTPLDAIDKYRSIMEDLKLNSPKSSSFATDIVNLKSSVNPIRLKNNPILIDESASEYLYKLIIRR